MTPTDADLKRLTDRRTFLTLGLAACCGCATPLFRGQSPELDAAASAEQSGPELVGNFARPVGLTWTKLESVALVTNLDNTGSDPPPSNFRQMLIDEMQSHDVRHPDKVLASPTTSMVMTRAFLPPGVQKGDQIDVEVRVSPGSETSSLRAGWLMQTRLRQIEVGGGSLLRGSIDGIAAGDVLVDAIFDGASDRIHETRGRVLGGATSQIAREIGLGISDSDKSIRISALIGKAINSRFFTAEAGVKKGAATPERDNYLSLAVSPRYKHNLARYLRVVRNIALRENAVERTERLQLLQKKLLEPASCALAALQLEAIGNEAVPMLKEGLQSRDAEVQFYAAEALAYLDQAEAAAPLAAAAKNESAFRWHALTALATMTHVTALDGLTELLHVQSIETRYGAFRALRIRNASDPATKGEALGNKFRYHLVPTTGEPLVHIARTRVPELVVFGHEQRLNAPQTLKAGKRILITPLATGDLRAGRYDPGQETEYVTFPPLLDKLIRAIVRLGGGYADVIECLQEARQAGCLEARLAVEAMPRPDRNFYRDDDPLPEAPQQEQETEGADETGNRRAATPAPELFQSGPVRGRISDDGEGAAPGGTYVAPGYEEKKSWILDKLNPFPRKSDSAP